MQKKTAIIIGAGPAGITAAFELLAHTEIQPVVYEATQAIGGIAQTVEYKGNRMDLGGHRFFSKSDRVMQWWDNLLPLQGAPSRDDILLQREVPLSKKPGAPDPEQTDRVMLTRSRLSRIFYLRRFFDYPVALNAATVLNLGLWRMLRIGTSYLRSRLFPLSEERSLEDFFINRFGRELYQTFFKDYTEKVWGIACSRINKDWGAQRIKGLSLTKALLHAVRSLFVKDQSIGQKKAETSLIERFLYPKFGPGHLWHEAARLVREKGGEIHFGWKAVEFELNGDQIAAVVFEQQGSGERQRVVGDYVFSSMPIKDLICGCGEQVPPNVREVAAGLTYRDFLTVGLLVKKLRIRNQTKIATINDIVPDTWIYVQERDVKLGRIQLFNNWSPYLVRDPNTVWLGLEYFCDEGDTLWSMPDPELIRFAARELAQIDLLDEQDVMDGTVIRVVKAYPAYFGTYDRFSELREFTDRVANLFLIGRNGMHRYNNQDHSMLAAMKAVSLIQSGSTDKSELWQVNAEEEFHESK